MCGIAGISLKKSEPFLEDMLTQMSDHLAHRGPDGNGMHIHDTTGIAHRRLSIIDIEGGQQPISDETNMVHIAVNGEIYNYLPLRNQLAAEGTTFKTASDSEIPLHLYKKHGLQFVHHLEGMYALAIYDEAEETLILARDPIGIKPLYISETKAGIAFASEPAALTKAGWTEAKLNLEALPDFINRQFTSGDTTLFTGIRRMLPGEILAIRHGEIVDDYRIFPELRAARSFSENEALEGFEGLFTDKVRSHVQADVPYGAFLSGGIDSSSVVSKMADIAHPIRTYTIGFESISVADERAMAEHLAKQLDTKHSTVEFSEADFWQYLPQMCTALDDLAADYAALPTLKLAEMATKDVKVVLSGEGGDEIFAGYGRYRRHSPLRKLLGRPFRGRGDAARHGFLFRNAERFAKHYRHELPDRRYGKLGYTVLQTLQARDIAEWLPHNLLLKVDRCLMAHSVEGRVPLLDRETVTFAFALPDRLKVQGKKGKYLLKKWLGERHSDRDVWAPKRGFTVPIQEWLEKKREVLADYLSGHAALENIVLPQKIHEWLQKPLDSKDAKLLFNFLCLAVWYDVHIDGKRDGWAWQ